MKPERNHRIAAMTVAGMSDRYGPQTLARIPSLWGRFMHLLGHIPGQVGSIAYGVCYNEDGHGHFDYMACVEVKDSVKLPEAFETLFIPARNYAVFVHRGPVEEIGATWRAIHEEAIPGGSLKVDKAAPCFERYDERFKPGTAGSEVEIWIPLAA